MSEADVPIDGAASSELTGRLRTSRLLRLGLEGALLLGVAVLATNTLWLVARIMFNRWDFPAELEWMEGGMLGHVARIARGEPLYVEPSPEWVPFIYHPLYYYVSWVASWFLGLGLPAMRCVSLLGYVASLAGLCAVTWRATRSRTAALVAPTMYAATFELGGAWFDVARVDSLAQGLFMLGLVAVRGRSLRAQLSAAALFFLCFLTKQAALSMFAPVVA